MDRWKAEVRRVREREEKKKEDQGRERVRRQKTQVHEKVAKSRNTMFFQWSGAPEGRKVGSLKRRVRSQLARWEMKSCTPLWREAHLEVNNLKTPHVRSTFGSCDVEKVHAVVARSTFRSQKWKKLRGWEQFWMVGCGLRGRHKGFCTLPKWAKRESIFKSGGRRVEEICSWEMFGGQGADFWEGLHFGAWDLQVC